MLHPVCVAWRFAFVPTSLRFGRRYVIVYQVQARSQQKADEATASSGIC